MTARTDHPSAHRCAHGQRIGAPCMHCDTEARLKHEAQHLRRALIYAADLLGCNVDDLTDAVDDGRMGQSTTSTPRGG